MKPVDREGNGLRKVAGTGDHSPEQQSPIMESLLPDDPQNNYRPYECGNVVEPEMEEFFLGGDMFPKECPDPFIVGPG